MDSIRQATPADAGLIAEIINASVHDSRHERVPASWVREDMFNGDMENVLLSDSTGVVGFGSAIHLHDGKEGYINFISVQPEARGRGHGKVLLDYLLAELDSRPHDRITTYITDINLAAVGFYLHYGFQPIQDVSWHIGYQAG